MKKFQTIKVGTLLTISCWGLCNHIKKIEVFPRNEMYADFIDGKEVMIIWDNRAAPNEKERAISDSDDGTIFTPYLNVEQWCSR